MVFMLDVRQLGFPFLTSRESNDAATSLERLKGTFPMAGQSAQGEDDGWQPKPCEDCDGTGITEEQFAAYGSASEGPSFRKAQCYCPAGMAHGRWADDAGAFWGEDN